MLSVLSSLSGSLTRLDLVSAAVPPSLPLLTRLQHLSLKENGESHDPSHAVSAAVSHLTQLTCLVSCRVGCSWEGIGGQHAWGFTSEACKRG